MDRSEEKGSGKSAEMLESSFSVIDVDQLLMSLDELEERLSMQIIQGEGLDGICFCLWYTCHDVCPPGG